MPHLWLSVRTISILLLFFTEVTQGPVFKVGTNAGIITPIVENQMEKKTQHEMETGMKYKRLVRAFSLPLPPLSVPQWTMPALS